MNVRFPALVVALLLAGGCSGVRVAPGPAPTVVTPGADRVPPLTPAEAGPRPGPQDGLEGLYSLVEANDTVVPAVTERRGGCVVRVVTGTLALEGDRFAFSVTTQESCGTATRDAVTRNARGDVRRDGGALVLTAEEGAAFRSARVLIVEDRELRMVELAAADAAGPVNWLFRRDAIPRRG